MAAPSLQPSRIRVLDRTAAILDEAPRHPASGFPTEYSHYDLARGVYATDNPTAAQLSAVRRAVAKLVGAGRAVRDVSGHGRSPLHERGTHERVRGGYVYTYANPAPMLVSRVPTDSDREARAAAEALFRAKSRRVLDARSERG
jgi:hypothetical protein